MSKRKKDDNESESKADVHEPEFSISDKAGVSKADFYRNLVAEAKSIISGEKDLIANTSNLSSLIFHGLNQRDAKAKINWAGFYFMRPNKTGKDHELVLGPFQGIRCESEGMTSLNHYRTDSLHTYSCRKRRLWHVCQVGRHCGRVSISSFFRHI